MSATVDIDPIIARLERELVEWPEDPGPWNVYLDRLIEVGDAGWARWLSLHLARERTESAGEKRSLQRAIRDLRFDAIGPELVALIEETRDYRPRAWITFVHGFAYFARLRLRPKSGDCAHAVRVLVTSRPCRFLRQLRIGVWDPIAETHGEDMLAALAGFALPALELLELQMHYPTPVRDRLPLSDGTIAAVFRAAPRLEIISAAGKQMARR